MSEGCIFERRSCSTLEADAAGGVAVDEVDEVPRDAAGAEAGGDPVDGFLRQAFEEAADCASHADLDLGDAEGEGSPF